MYGCVRLQYIEFLTVDFRLTIFLQALTLRYDMSCAMICVFRCKTSVMGLIQCHAWTAGYHTPSCPANRLSFQPVPLEAAFCSLPRRRGSDSREI